MPKHEVTTKWFVYRQTNSGGRFVINEKNGIGHVVCIEAINADDANFRALGNIGLYFDGVDKRIDCDCCGDRWTTVDDSDGLEDFTQHYSFAKQSKTWKKFFGENIVYLHHFDGRIEKWKFQET